ncbi:glycosyltransferase family 2 protein [Echinicola marina]|uniref:glycosyltransferase family 2 protein n=1 Tax=Echinicola marina TaxID=2859768 RepID=UPI001CF63352|nr:glycosyltransferase family 2 protein [Echinicola marina]UCS94383.1 glycosyltransferase family 2 protein [Echinicola marina]
MNFTGEPSVAIILVNWNSYTHTRNCLISLRKVSYGNYKIIVVDNASSDKSGDRLESKFEEIVLLRNEKNLGFTGGNNTGINFALENGFEYLMLLNNDTEVLPDFLSLMMERMKADKEIGAIQPKFYFLNQKERIWNAGGRFHPFLGLTQTIGKDEPNKAKYDQYKEVDWITGCCFLVRSEIIEKIGGLTDKLFIYYEDVDWSFKIRELGYKLYIEPSSIVYHEAGMSHKKKEKGKEGYLNPIVHYLNARNHIWFLRKYIPWYYSVPVGLYSLFKYAGYFAYFLVRGRFIKIKFMFRGLKEGLFLKGI